MNTCTTTVTAATGTATGPARALTFATTLVLRLGAWRAQLAKAARDREALAQMSERELHDVGLARGFVDDVASGAWQRDALR